MSYLPFRILGATEPKQVPKHPGEFLVMALEAMKMRQAELARRSGLSTKHVNQICTGKVPISAKVAILIEETLGVDAAHWVRLQGAYDLAVARVARQDELEAQRARRQAWIEQVGLDDA